jgi:Carboxypeptidase regulatory-like domain
MYLSLLALLLLIVAPTLISAQTPTMPDIRSEERKETCTLSGTVVRKLDGAPLKGATVWLASDENREHTMATTTAADGRFELRNVPAGRYRLTVRRNGYVDAYYGQKKADDPGSILTLRPGQKLVDLVFKLGRTGVISGRIYDEDGESMQGIRVNAVRKVYINGKLQLQTYDERQTNDLGEFRLFGLSPGRYLITAEPELWNRVVGDREFSGADKNGGEKGYAKLYYPGVNDSGKASAITVKEGDEIASIDILMKQVTVYRVRGKVVNLLPKPSKRGWSQVNLLRINQGAGWESIGGASVGDADGSFDIREIPPGNYTIRVMLRSDDGRMHVTQQDIAVGNADVEGLTLTVGEGVNIAGRVTWDGTPKLERQGFVIAATSTENEQFPGTSGEVDDNNQFTLKDVHDGEFRLDAWGISKDCYLKEVRYSDTIVPDATIRVAKGTVGSLEITLSSRGAHVQGAVLNEDTLPAVGAWAVAIPDKKTRRASYSANTDQYGHFEVRGLPPGKYKLFSWRALEQGAWEDPEFLTEYEEKVTVIEVHEGDTKTVELKLIAVKEADVVSE